MLNTAYKSKRGSEKNIVKLMLSIHGSCAYLYNTSYLWCLRMLPSVLNNQHCCSETTQSLELMSHLWDLPLMSQKRKYSFVYISIGLLTELSIFVAMNTLCIALFITAHSFIETFLDSIENNSFYSLLHRERFPMSIINICDKEKSG